MPSYVNPEKCDGCKGGDKTVCMYICPNDLMILDPEAMKAYNQEPDQCWECYSCVKKLSSRSNFCKTLCRFRSSSMEPVNLCVELLTLCGQLNLEMVWF